MPLNQHQSTMHNEQVMQMILSTHTLLRYTFLAAAVWLLTGTLQAQQTVGSDNLPRTISYQGILNGPDGSPLPDGTYDISVALCTDPQGTDELWSDRYRADVRGGLFQLYLGDGTPLPIAAELDRPLWVRMQLGNNPPMYPLTPLSASPYALNVADGSIGSVKLEDGAVTFDKVGFDYIAGVSVAGNRISGQGSILNLEAGDGLALTYDDRSNTLRFSRPMPTTGADPEKGARTLAGTDRVWSMTGDGWDVGGSGSTNAGANDWLGTGTAQDLEIRVNNTTALRYVPNGTWTPNVLGGNGANMISGGSYGVVIDGGGSSTNPNAVSGNALYATIGGGEDNSVSANYGTIGGGDNNSVSGTHGTVGGGLDNFAIGTQATVGGGSENSAQGDYTAVAGGIGNLASGDFAGIATGYSNIAGGDYSSIGGGRLNTTEGYGARVGGGGLNDAYSTYGTIGGGEDNSVSYDHATVGGGHLNSAAGLGATVGGGGTNAASSSFTTVAGGEDNAASALYSTIGGGNFNEASGDYSTIAGGSQNTASGTFATIGGGLEQTATALYAGVASGRKNEATGNYSTVGGGYLNRAWGLNSTIPGGESLNASLYGQTVVGFHNATRGYVPSQPTAIDILTLNDPLFIVGNGAIAFPGGGSFQSNAFEVSYNGHSVVYDVNGTSQGTWPGSRAPILGATYRDNIIYAWGDIGRFGAVNSDVGVANVNHPAPGTYIITIRIDDPLGAAAILNNAAITATLADDGEGNPFGCAGIRVSRIGIPGPNQFTVYTFNSNCAPENSPFMFHLTGRP